MFRVSEFMTNTTFFLRLGVRQNLVVHLAFRVVRGCTGGHTNVLRTCAYLFATLHATVRLFHFVVVANLMGITIETVVINYSN